MNAAGIEETEMEATVHRQRVFSTDVERGGQGLRCARFAVIINGEHLFEVVAEIFKLVAELVAARVV